MQTALINKPNCVIILGHAENCVIFVSVAQGTEHRSPKAGVGGSNPLRDTNRKVTGCKPVTFLLNKQSISSRSSSFSRKILDDFPETAPEFKFLRLFAPLSPEKLDEYRKSFRKINIRMRSAHFQEAGAFAGVSRYIPEPPQRGVHPIRREILTHFCSKRSGRWHSRGRVL